MGKRVGGAAATREQDHGGRGGGGENGGHVLAAGSDRDRTQGRAGARHFPGKFRLTPS